MTIVYGYIILHFLDKQGFPRTLMSPPLHSLYLHVDLRTQVIFITEYMSSGSLKQFLKKTKKNHKTMNVKVSVSPIGEIPSDIRDTSQLMTYLLIPTVP